MLQKRSQIDGFKSSKHPLYAKWRNIKHRCYNHKAPKYLRYGARGIYVCDEWLKDYTGFLNFVLWNKSQGWEEGSSLSIDRIDNDGPYSPENCRLATPKEQANNTSENIHYTFGDVTKTFMQWADFYSIKPHPVWLRINRRGWDPFKAFTTPIIKE